MKSAGKCFSNASQENSLLFRLQSIASAYSYRQSSVEIFWHLSLYAVLSCFGRFLKRGVAHWEVVVWVNDSFQRETRDLLSLVYHTSGKQFGAIVVPLDLRGGFNTPAKMHLPALPMRESHEQLLSGVLPTVMIVGTNDGIAPDFVGIKRVRVSQRSSSLRSFQAFLPSPLPKHRGHFQKNLQTSWERNHFRAKPSHMQEYRA